MKTKKIIGLLAATLFCAAISFGQAMKEDKIPQDVLSAFRNRFSDAVNVTWMKTPDSNYQAKFTMADTEQKAAFDMEGIWIETQTSIRKADLPEAVRHAVLTTNPSCKIANAEELQTAAQGKVYEVGCTAKTGSADYRVTADGTMLGPQFKK